MEQDPASDRRRQSLGSVIGSVFASMFGVQSSRKHQEDFKRGSAKIYIAVGLLATLAFIVTVWGVVQLVVAVAAKP